MTTDKLAPDALDDALAGLDGWSVAANGTAIAKTFGFGGFGDAMRFVNRVAGAAEAKNHHPDIEIGYDEVTVRLSTHSAGGVTDRDLDLARAVEEAA